MKENGKQPIWKKDNPKSKSEEMTSDQKAKAKRAAKAHGRSQPSLVENINAQKSAKSSKKKGSEPS